MQEYKNQRGVAVIKSGKKEEKLVPVSQSLAFRHLQHCILGPGGRGTERMFAKKRFLASTTDPLDLTV